MRVCVREQLPAPARAEALAQLDPGVALGAREAGQARSVLRQLDPVCLPTPPLRSCRLCRLQHSPATRPSVESTAERVFLLSDRVYPSSISFGVPLLESKVPS